MNRKHRGSHTHTKRRVSGRQKPRGWDIWQFNTIVSRRLLLWAGINIAAGVWLQQQRNKFWRGVAMQSISWGAINAGIAVIGGAVTQSRQQQLTDPHAKEIVEREHRNLYRLLWINAGLDVGYVLGGLILALTRGSKNRLMRGNGWGIVIQGGFLLLFDAVHALIMASKKTQR